MKRHIRFIIPKGSNDKNSPRVSEIKDEAYNNNFELQAFWINDAQTTYVLYFMKTFSGSFYSWGCSPVQQTILGRFYYNTGKAFYQVVLPRMPVAYQALAMI